MSKTQSVCPRYGNETASCSFCLCPDEPPSDWEVSNSKFVSSIPKEELLKDIENSRFVPNRLEKYTILKDNKFFASFTEGDESRFGEPMSYEVFRREYSLCVNYWEMSHSVSPIRFSYLIVYI
jgi:hypothetical protein